MKSSSSSLDKANTGARGDCVYVPVHSNRIICNSIDDKNASLHFDYKTDRCFRSNLASGEPEQNQVCFSTSSATFIVSPSSEITKEHTIDDIIHSNTNPASMKECNNDHEKHVWFKEHWISVTIIIGIIIISIIIIIH